MYNYIFLTYFLTLDFLIVRIIRTLAYKPFTYQLQRCVRGKHILTKDIKKKQKKGGNETVCISNRAYLFY